MHSISPFISICRPKQWIKNGFVFGPLLFSGQILNPDAILAASIAALLFCLAASATYIINDIADVEEDKRNPRRALSRPLANGSLKLSSAVWLLAALYGCLIVGLALEPAIAPVIGAYLVLNLFYSYWLKHIAVVDIFCISFGFVLRVYAGTVVLALAPSYWMLITTLTLALFLAAIKRRQELLSRGTEARASLHGYTLTLIDRYAEMSGTGALVFYSLFVLTNRPELVITIPFVLFGLFRYWYVVELHMEGESPTDLLWQDKPLILCIVIWVVLAAMVLQGML